MNTLLQTRFSKCLSNKIEIFVFLFKNYRYLCGVFEYLFIMSAKRQRLSVIEKILRTEVIRSQDDLQKSLTDRGFEVTQATLSRDIRQLKIIKTPDSDGHYMYILPEKEPSFIAPQLDEPIVEFSGNLAMIKTRPGYAMGIASDIDKHAPDEILGTIAGDDTILVIPREGYTQIQVKEVLTKILNNRHIR